MPTSHLPLVSIEPSSRSKDSFLTLSNETFQSLLKSTRPTTGSSSSSNSLAPNHAQNAHIIQLIHPATSKWIFLLSFPHLRDSRRNELSDRILSKFEEQQMRLLNVSGGTGVGSSSVTLGPGSAAALGGAFANLQNFHTSSAFSSTIGSQKYFLNLIYNGPIESIDHGVPTRVQTSSLAPNFQIIWNVEDLIVKPCSENDYEILELNEKNVAEQMLNQHRVFTKGMIFPFWIDENLVIYLEVVGTTHERWNYNSFVYVIGRKTEFLIDRLTNKNPSEKKEKNRHFFEKTIKEMDLRHFEEMQQKSPIQTHIFGSLQSMRCIVVEKKWAASMGFENGDVVELFHSVRHVPSQQQTGAMQMGAQQTKMRRTRKTTFAIMYLISQSELPTLDEETIVVASDLIVEMDCQHHSRVFFRYSNLTTRQNISSIFLYRLFQEDPHSSNTAISQEPPTSENATELLRAYIAQHKKRTNALHVPFCARGIVQLSPHLRVLIAFNSGLRSRPLLHKQSVSPIGPYSDFSDPASPIMGNLFLVDDQKLEKVHLSTPADAFYLPQKSLPHMEQISATYENHFSNFKRLKQKLKAQLHEPCFFSSKVSYSLISGDAGNGKTTAAHSLCCSLNAHRVFISCNQLIGERADHILTVIKAKVADAMFHSPSIIIFDDLDTICPLEQEDGPPDMNIRLITSSLIDMLTLTAKRGISSQRLHNIACVFTSQSKESLNTMIQDAELFENQLYLSSPAETLRRRMLTDIWQMCHGSWTISDTVLGYICLKTEGYSVQDLKNICDQTVRQHLVNQMLSSSGKSVNAAGDNRGIMQADFDEAASTYVRQAEEGIKLVKSKSTWSDVGGLKDVIKAIQETFEYPGRYPEFFKKTPLKLRSGLLLYGPTGCGKTHLANVAAGACGLNFISVKGPEILNKYIGQSEENVRKLFRQAEAAKPCIIFFDEFDSIAASRGKDTTGVTDRVVNQFLCQMDGVESRDGVYVLAATSRPDLIDAALLRPGRLDKALHCGFPSLEDRLDILRVLTRNVQLHDDIDLEEIAQITEHFTGADLQGLLTNASIIAAHQAEEHLEEQLSNGQSSNDTTDTEQSLLHIDGHLKGNALSEDSQHVFDTLKLHLRKSAQSRTQQNEGNQDNAKRDGSGVCIQRAHILEALQESQPSVGKEERLRLEYIYEKFRDGKKKSNPSATNSLGDVLRDQQHVTLA